MNAEPTPVSQISPMTPPELDRLVRACLVKDPHDRLQSAHDVKMQLAWLGDGGASQVSSASAALPGVSAAKPRTRWPWIAAAAVAGALVTGGTMMWMQRANPSQEATTMPRLYALSNANLSSTSSPVIAPDGSFVVFVANDAGTRRLYRRDMSSFEVTALPGTEDALAPFMSPDGAWIGFSTSAALKKMPVSGGVPQVIISEPQIDSADWGADGMIYYAPRAGGGAITALARVPAMGGAPEVVASLDTTASEAEAWLPEILPDGKTVLISVIGGNVSWHIDAVTPGGKRVRIVDNALLGRYAAGQLLYVDMISEAVLCVPFDVAQLKIGGPALPLTEPVDPAYAYDVSHDGTIVYVPMPGAGAGKELVWLQRDGSSAPAMDTRGAWTQPRVSPDGKRVLLRKVETNCELWMLDIERGALGRIAQNTDNHDPIWSPDGRRIAYTQLSAGGHMVVQTVEGAHEVRTIDTRGEEGHPRGWSAGGNRLVYTVDGRGTRSDVWTCVMDGTSKPEPFVRTEFEEKDPSISPDGRFIAYVTNEAGSNEVFVRPCPQTGESWQVSIGGGLSPLWSRNGRELFFTVGTRMMSASIDTHGGFSAGRPVQLFDGGFSTERALDFDVAPDGRFVAVRVPGGTSGQREMRVLLNWPAELRRLEGPARER